MSHRKEYDRLNTRMNNYVQAVNDKADGERLHHLLKELIDEAIKVDITPAKLLEALSGSTIIEGHSKTFLENVSKHYERGKIAAKDKPLVE